MSRFDLPHFVCLGGRRLPAEEKYILAGAMFIVLRPVSFEKLRYALCQCTISEGGFIIQSGIVSCNAVQWSESEEIKVLINQHSTYEKGKHTGLRNEGNTFERIDVLVLIVMSLHMTRWEYAISQMRKRGKFELSFHSLAHPSLIAERWFGAGFNKICKTRLVDGEPFFKKKILQRHASSYFVSVNRYFSFLTPEPTPLSKPHISGTGMGRRLPFFKHEPSDHRNLYSRIIAEDDGVTEAEIVLLCADILDRKQRGKPFPSNSMGGSLPFTLCVNSYAIEHFVSHASPCNIPANVFFIRRN